MRMQTKRNAVDLDDLVVEVVPVEKRVDKAEGVQRGLLLRLS
jgi:hypothetical protein